MVYVPIEERRRLAEEWEKNPKKGAEYEISVEFLNGRLDDILNTANNLNETNTSECGDALSGTGEILKEISKINKKYGVYLDDLQNKALEIASTLHSKCIAKSIEERRTNKTKR